MVDPIAIGDEVPEADRLEQHTPIDDIEAPDPAGPLTPAWDADEADQLEQSIEVPVDEDHYDDE